jgi:chitin disaccharide deacetylase
VKKTERKNSLFILSADDFGISPGVNNAVIEAHKNGYLTHTSVMANMPFARDACTRRNNEAPGLHVGLHLNLSVGSPISHAASVRALVGGDGRFRHGFLGLLLLPVFTYRNNEILCQVETEIESQIVECLRYGVRPEHIDSHRHIHTIPWIFNITLKLAKKYNIDRVRILNESLLNSLKLPHRLRMLYGGGLIKYLVLKTLYYINGRKSDIYFFSILHGSKITPDMLGKLIKPDGFARIEIMLHPGDPGFDREPPAGLPYNEKLHMRSPYRVAEYHTALSR